MPYRFVESPNKPETSGRTFAVVVMHTMEIAERPDAAMICARWFATGVSRVSAHDCVDAQTVIQCVREKDVAWHARGGNTHSIGVELAGFARQTTHDWEDAYSTAGVLVTPWRSAPRPRRRRSPVHIGRPPTTSLPDDAGSPATPR